MIESGVFVKKRNFLWLAVATILLAGIFLRTYNYHDWLRFNADQGRDAIIVSDVLAGNQSWPLLGPKAGGTAFLLGPIFYYFQIISAMIFGDAPDKMAYPDLFAGIVCIPMLYLFLRKYFDIRIVLALSAIFALSEFAIRWARFAWNPNSTPLWILFVIYTLHEIIIKKENKKFWWAIGAGISIGVSVQLHTMLLLSLPIMLSILFVYFFIKKNRVWEYLLMALAVAFLVNIPQVIHGYASNGSNIVAFFDGITTKQSNQHSFIENILQGNSSIAQIVPNILTGYEISDNFEITFSHKYFMDVLVFFLGMIFALSGIVLAIFAYKKETDTDKKTFLAIIFLYVGVSYLLFMKLAFTISVRMYLVLFFVPFFFLGFWLQFLGQKFNEKYRIFSIIIITILFVGMNLFSVGNYFKEFAGYYNGEGSVNIATLGGMERFARFISQSSPEGSKAVLTGDKKFLFISSRPITYLLKKSRIDLVVLGRNDILSSSIPQFYAIVRENKLDDFNNDPNYTITKQETYGKFSILLLEKK